MGLGQYNSQEEYCGPRTASFVFLILILHTRTRTQIYIYIYIYIYIWHWGPPPPPSRAPNRSVGVRRVDEAGAEREMGEEERGGERSREGVVSCSGDAPKQDELGQAPSGELLLKLWDVFNAICFPFYI